MHNRLNGRIPYLYVEHARLKSKGTSVVAESDADSVVVPVNSLASLLLGPGTSVTHQAMRLCANAGVVVEWVGEEGSSAYAVADPLTGDGERVTRQVACAFNAKGRARVVRYLFARRFGQPPPAGAGEATVRGLEGARIKGIYKDLAREYGLVWPGRKSGTGGSWNTTDPLNQAISIANGHLLQAATVAVLAAGFHPGVGFLHKGFNRAFAADIADLYKFQHTVPLAFAKQARGMVDPRKELRHSVRDLIVRENLIENMIFAAIEAVDAGFGRN